MSDAGFFAALSGKLPIKVAECVAPPKNTAVWNRAHGTGRFLRVDKNNPNLCIVRFEKQWHNRYTHQVGLLGLKVLADGKWVSVTERRYLPGETMSERAFRDFLIGWIRKDHDQLRDGLYALVSLT